MAVTMTLHNLPEGFAVRVGGLYASLRGLTPHYRALHRLRLRHSPTLGR